MEQFFSKVEKYQAPSTILFRSIELKLLKQKFGDLFDAKTILDLGCGQGIAASIIFDKKIDYGLDNDQLGLQQAEKSNLYQKLILADAKNIPLPDNSIDLAFSNSVIEHIKELNSVLKEVYRILGQNGVFIFTVPSDCFKNYSLFSFLKMIPLAKIYGELRNKKFNHHHAYSLQEWTSILKSDGFQEIDGYHYLKKRTLEFWDFLLIFSWPFRLMPKINQKLSNWIYKTFFRKQIYKKFVDSEITDSKGAALCLIGQKI